MKSQHAETPRNQMKWP